MYKDTQAHTEAYIRHLLAAGLPVPDNELDRLAELKKLCILDTLPEVEYTTIVHLAASLCGAPTALITLLDEHRQWFKARVGMEHPETERIFAFCQYTLSEHDYFCVPNALLDERFANNPLVTAEQGIRFYLGIPLVGPSQHALGALCVIDSVPRTPDPAHIAQLQLLARLTVRFVYQRFELLVAKELLSVTASAIDRMDDR
ncbi:MAG: GAF domain-containing protein [Bacteroidia bacterium]|nr:GAF domain-containing protein [Bacteroidia bacterium]